MKVKDAYKLKRFGTYFVEIDTDNQQEIKKFSKSLKKHLRFRFIKFILIPMGVIKLTEIQSLSDNQQLNEGERAK